jgi:hypothetical protein
VEQTGSEKFSKCSETSAPIGLEVFRFGSRIARQR